jgi:hypothetical protein
MSDLAYKVDDTKSFYGIAHYLPRQSNSGALFLVGSPRPATASTDTKFAFKMLADEWKKDTAHMSMVSKRLQHPAFRRILGMGRGVVPLILEEMDQHPDHWFYALAYLTGENPVPHDFAGTVEDAVDLWIRWGRSRYAG